MDVEEMKRRTKDFAINCGHLILRLPKNIINNAYAAQPVRSSSSVGANTEPHEEPNLPLIL